MDAAAQATLVEQYKRMVWKIAVKIWALRLGRRLGAIEDLVQEGFLALLRAAENFDASMGCKFVTYAHIVVMRRMVDSCFRQGIIAVPSSFRGSNPRWDHLRPAALAAWNTEALPTGLYGGDALPAKEAADEPEEHDFELVEQAMRRLDKRSRDVLRLRYFEGRTAKEAGDVLGVTAQRVQQIQAAAIGKIKKMLKDRL